MKKIKIISFVSKKKMEPATSAEQKRKSRANRSEEQNLKKERGGKKRNT